uniref:Uncharacterized protein n=1 Tax=Setaria viridis TaxID=4556 RepID=A0A4U6VHV8_SETVI|nr:hypothetical protein SEVIR_3G308400v2 [Setaria viridis]
MASTNASSLKGTLVVAICVMLLHSSMGQQPAPSPAPMPPTNCIPYCGSICDQMCKARYDAAVRQCDGYRPEVIYKDCFERCSTQCNGNSAYARGSCNLGSCSASSCGCPCARSCCESCTASANYPYGMCMSGKDRVYGNCMNPCMTDCNNKCVNGSLPSTP